MFCLHTARNPLVLHRASVTLKEAGIRIATVENLNYNLYRMTPKMGAKVLVGSFGGENL